jgi:hypothetical protein
VQDLELQRVTALREALHNVTASYTTALLPLHQSMLKLQSAVEAINSEAELDELHRWVVGAGGGLCRGLLAAVAGAC